MGLKTSGAATDSTDEPRPARKSAAVVVSRCDPESWKTLSESYRANSSFMNAPSPFTILRPLAVQSVGATPQSASSPPSL